MFVDSSALVAMLLPESDAIDYFTRLQQQPEAYTSPMAIFETALALRRLRDVPLSETIFLIEESLRRLGIRNVEIEAGEYIGALQAFERYGKGTGSRAQLNMGDCFSYAITKRLGMLLLYKGDDFAHTDLA